MARSLRIRKRHQHTAAMPKATIPDDAATSEDRQAAAVTMPPIANVTHIVSRSRSRPVRHVLGRGAERTVTTCRPH